VEPESKRLDIHVLDDEVSAFCCAVGTLFTLQVFQVCQHIGRTLALTLC